MGFFRQEYWSGLPLPTPGDLPDPGFDPHFLKEGRLDYVTTLKIFFFHWNNKKGGAPWWGLRDEQVHNLGVIDSFKGVIKVHQN